MTLVSQQRFSAGRWAALLLAAVCSSASAITALVPGSDGEVLEVLPAVTRSRPAAAAPAVAAARPADPDAIAAQARAQIGVARQTGDTRYWGRAQALLAPWWDKADAPADLAVLQATVQQGRHEFDAARKLLVSTLERTPGHAQGWLNLAALERLSGRYAQSLLACDAVARAGQALYASACRLETQSLQGQHQVAEQGFTDLLGQVRQPSQQSWLWSLLAEARERSGQDKAAADAYTRSLAFEADLYTSIAYTDLLLRTGKTSLALQALGSLPDTDAVLLRRAAAWQRLGDVRWKEPRALLQERSAELLRRGDDPALHGREAALAALWLDGDAPGALALARSNLLLQREPLDWWVALQSARLAKDTAALAELSAQVRNSGLSDARLGALK